MATPTSAIDDLLGLLSPSEQVIMREIILKNDRVKTQLDEGLTMRKEYLGDETPGDEAARAAAVKAAADKAAADRAEADRVAAASRAAAGNNTSPDLSAITKQLSDLNNTLTTKLADLEKKVVTIDKLPEYRGEILGITIKQADLLGQVRAQHAAEFPTEPFELDKLNTFVNENQTKGIRYPDIKAAYDAMMGEKRTEAKIAKGIAEGIKQKKSAESAGAAAGGDSTVALSPGQELLRKARGAESTGDHVLAFANKLKNIKESREAREGGVEAAS